MPSVKYSSESESSDSDDDNLAQLREAVDTDLINDKMFELAGKKSQEEAVDTSKNEYSDVNKVKLLSQNCLYSRTSYCSKIAKIY